MFESDDANVEHIAEHGVTPEEAEEAVTDPRRVRLDAYNAPTEVRRGYIGRTAADRLLAVVITRRGNRFRVVTARNATQTERRRYRGKGQ